MTLNKQDLIQSMVSEHEKRTKGGSDMLRSKIRRQLYNVDTRQSRGILKPRLPSRGRGASVLSIHECACLR